MDLVMKKEQKGRICPQKQEEPQLLDPGQMETDSGHDTLMLADLGAARVFPSASHRQHWAWRWAKLHPA